MSNGHCIRLFTVIVLLATQFTPSRAAENNQQVVAESVTLFVTTNGNDANDCLTVGTPCLTINAAIGKATSGDTIKVATGTYTGTGSEVVLVNKSVILSGGWNADFTTQDGMSTIDGEVSRRGVYVFGSTAVIKRFIVQKGYSTGVYNRGTLTIDNSIITHNTSSVTGGGIFNYDGTLIVNDSVISYNRAGELNSIISPHAAGIYSSGSLILNRSAVINNTLIGGYYQGSGVWVDNGSAIINNSTISGNKGGSGILIDFGNIEMNHSTVSDNEFTGMYTSWTGHISIQNSIIARNGTTMGDCFDDSSYSGRIISQGYNLIGNGTQCGIAPIAGDQIGTSSNPIDPKMSSYPIYKGGFYVLQPDSPAVNTANPATCLSTDQRGVSRPQGAGCDIGAYEFGTTPGSPAFTGVSSGSYQSAFRGHPFPDRLAVYVIDDQGNPIDGVSVTFTAPSSGAGGVFASASSPAFEGAQSEFGRLSKDRFANGVTHEVTVETVFGIAVAPLFKANFLEGDYMVSASVEGFSEPLHFFLSNLSINSEPDFLQNGNFEDPILGKYWDAYSSNFGTPFCTLPRCGHGGGTAGPRSGTTWVWFGGVPAPYLETGFITQSNLIIPSGPARLRFYLRIGYAEPGSNANDKLTVTIHKKSHDFIVFSVDATQQSQYAQYKLVEIDLSPYADGSANYINIRFASTTNHLVNFSIDDISINNAIFGDVDPGHWAWSWIERLFSADITGGCSTNPVLYCPNNPVTRAQMAVFLLRGIHGSSYTPPPVTGTVFTDVPAGSFAAAWIEQLANEGITGGCGSGNYCPSNSVTRAQMAIFLLRSKYGSGYTPPPATGTMFADVPANAFAAAWIEQLANEGITGGCGGGNFCPNNPVTRAQMAIFLVRTFNLP
jgi:hypothetical protein